MYESNLTLKASITSIVITSYCLLCLIKKPYLLNSMNKLAVLGSIT